MGFTRLLRNLARDENFGKHVVPITQAGSDIPFDLQHHRYLAYLNNGEGRQALEGALRARFTSLRR